MTDRCRPPTSAPDATSVDSSGRVTLRYQSRLHHIGLGRGLAGTRILLLVHDLNVRILTEEGELLRAFVLDPTKDYQARG